MVVCGGIGNAALGGGGSREDSQVSVALWWGSPGLPSSQAVPSGERGKEPVRFGFWLIKTFFLLSHLAERQERGAEEPGKERAGLSSP